MRMLRAARPATFAVLGLLATGLLSACQDDPTLPEPETSEAVLDEAALAAAAEEVATLEAELRHEAEQRASEGRPTPDRVELAVALGASAVELAARLLDEEGADPEQLRLLDAAKDAQRQAVIALERGDPGRALAFARRACWTALHAVVLPGGVTLEEARMIHQVAGTLLAEARATVDPNDPTASLLLKWAGRMYEAGSRALEGGSVRSVAVLWKSAVLSAYLTG
jgi:hypothetical protein